MSRFCYNCKTNNTDDAVFCGNCGHQLRTNQRTVTIIVLVILIVALFIILIPLTIYNEKLEYINDDLENRISEMTAGTESETTEIAQENDILLHRLSQLTQKYPIIITGIEIANVDKEGSIETDFGDKIYDYNTMYLKPRITYIGFKEQKLNLYCKLIEPNGKMATGKESPYGYSYASEIWVSNTEGEKRDKKLSGWGGGDKGQWSSGEYVIEIWYNGICLKAKNFTIY